MKLNVICAKKIQLKSSEKINSLNPNIISGVKQLIVDNIKLLKFEKRPIQPALNVGTYLY